MKFGYTTFPRVLVPVVGSPQVENPRWLAENGYDPVYGARPLRRLMQREIDDKLANLILDGQVEDGSIVKADVAVDGEHLSVLAETHD